MKNRILKRQSAVLLLFGLVWFINSGLYSESVLAETSTATYKSSTYNETSYYENGPYDPFLPVPEIELAEDFDAEILDEDKMVIVYQKDDINHFTSDIYVRVVTKDGAILDEMLISNNIRNSREDAIMNNYIREHGEEILLYSCSGNERDARVIRELGIDLLFHGPYDYTVPGGKHLKPKVAVDRTSGTILVVWQYDHVLREPLYSVILGRYLRFERGRILPTEDEPRLFSTIPVITLNNVLFNIYCNPEVCHVPGPTATFAVAYTGILPKFGIPIYDGHPSGPPLGRFLYAYYATVRIVDPATSLFTLQDERKWSSKVCKGSGSNAVVFNWISKNIINAKDIICINNGRRNKLLIAFHVNKNEVTENITLEGETKPSNKDLFLGSIDMQDRIIQNSKLIALDYIPGLTEISMGEPKTAPNADRRAVLCFSRKEDFTCADITWNQNNNVIQYKKAYYQEGNKREISNINVTPLSGITNHFIVFYDLGSYMRLLPGWREVAFNRLRANVIEISPQNKFQDVYNFDVTTGYPTKNYKVKGLISREWPLAVVWQKKREGFPLELTSDLCTKLIHGLNNMGDLRNTFWLKNRYLAEQNSQACRLGCSEVKFEWEWKRCGLNPILDKGPILGEPEYTIHFLRDDFDYSSENLGQELNPYILENEDDEPHIYNQVLIAHFANGMDKMPESPFWHGIKLEAHNDLPEWELLNNRFIVENRGDDRFDERIRSLSINEGQELSFQVRASDRDGEIVDKFCVNLPNDAEYIKETGRVTWTPGFDQAGRHCFTFTATDDRGANAIMYIIIYVNNVQ